jgi:hypothetical protein
MGKKAQVVFAGLVASLISAGSLHAGESDHDTKARQGTVRCGGNNFLRQGGTEVHFTSYNLRNYGSAPITIERMTFFDATGAVLFDTNTSGFPVFSNGVLGPADQVLEPNQTAGLDSADLLPFLPQTQRPIQLEITWSAPERVLILDVALVRIARQRDPVTGQQLQERSRHLRDCRTIGLKN